jgi:PHD/YefM family antitoxin component YafN of YafNO toxin-antitoxin module
LNLTLKQIQALNAGQPVVIEIEGAGKIYLLSEEHYRQMMLVLQSEPDQQAFRELAAEEADRIATENPY